ncbi:MAG: hypothetical protein IPJ81_06730 [Chitinophagaceae bacterium]|nr:hypothetical protein [Chitinophagaceae bacterium]
MKKLLLSIFIIFLFYGSFSQPIINRAGSANTTQDGRGMWLYNAFMPRYVDTVAANLEKGIDTAGAIIYTYDVNSIWYRQNSPKKWVLLSNGNAPVYTADRGVKIITGDVIRLTDTVEGAGTKFQWIYDLAAFRAGEVSGTQWDVANIGQYSFSGGQNNIASGTGSFSIGSVNESSGNYSATIGAGNIASSLYATAIGSGSTASGASSFAAGESLTASGNNSTSFGTTNTASGVVSTAIGNFTKAVGNNSLSTGVGTYMNTLNGVVFGAYNDTTNYYLNNTSTQVATDPIFTIGNGIGVGVRANAFQMLRNGATKFSSGITTTTDTTTFKPMVMDADGNVRKTSTWGVGIKNIYNSNGILTGDRVITGDGNDLTITGVQSLYLNAQDSAVYQGSISASDNSRQIATTSWANQKFGRNINTNTTQVGNVGGGIDDLMVDTIPANTLSSNGDYIEFYMHFFFASNANSKQIILYLGGTDFYTTGAQNQNDGSILLKGTIVRTASNTQLITIEQIVGSSSLFSTQSEYAGGAEDFTTNLALKATGIGVGNNDINQNLMIVKYYPAN